MTPAEEIKQFTRTISGQLLGGLAVELEKHVSHKVMFGQFHGDPALRVGTVWVMVDGNEFKVVALPPNKNERVYRRVLFTIAFDSPNIIQDVFNQIARASLMRA